MRANKLFFKLTITETGTFTVYGDNDLQTFHFRNVNVNSTKRSDFGQTTSARKMVSV